MHDSNELSISTAQTTKRKSSARQIVEQLLEPTGITINGSQPYDIQVHNPDFYQRVTAQGSLGPGESYMDKWWDCERLDMLFDKLLRTDIESKAALTLRQKANLVANRLLNMQTRRRAVQVADAHYNLGNDLFSRMLDKYMMYSCGYWKSAATLEQAQEAKLDLICQKLQLQSGMTLLDIGCGWGGLARFAAERYGAIVTGVTISDQQSEYAKAYCKDLPIDIRLQDYRDINEKFDRIVSVGMFEHVGHKNYRVYMETARKAMHDDALFLLHTIGNNETLYAINEWTRKYIFPNGMLPSIAQIAKASEGLFVMEDWQNFGAYYDNTLMAWHENFVNSWNDISSNYDERFYRMWVFYLLMSAGAFRARSIQLWQVMFSRGIEGVYMAPR